MEGFVRVRHVDPACNETAGQVFRALSVPLELEDKVLRLAPPVGKVFEEPTGPGLQLELIVQAINAKRREDILLEGLVLVITQNDEEIPLGIVLDHAPLHAIL